MRRLYDCIGGCPGLTIYRSCTGCAEGKVGLKRHKLELTHEPKLYGSTEYTDYVCSDACLTLDLAWLEYMLN